MLPPRRSPRKGRALSLEPLESRLLLSVNPVNLVNPVASVAEKLIGLDRVWAEYGFTGSGQTVAVIDSGVAFDHLALGDGYGPGHRVVGGYDFAERDSIPYDDGPMGSHGTHVAGILAGDDSRTPGVAPGADIVALRVFDDQGRGQFRWVEEALDWVHTHRNSFAHPITTVNLSLGTPMNTASVPSWATLENEFVQLEADGIFIAVAAGNGFATYHTTGLSYPAVSPHVVPVASIDAGGGLSYFSQRDSRVIAAPGRSILSSVPDYAGNRNGVADDFASYSGTSMATPFVAGASMLLRQAYEFAGLASPSEQTLYNTIIATADAVYDPITGVSYHRLNVDRAIDSVMPADDFGSTAAAAAGLGTITDTLSARGTIGQITDRDWFSFQAGASGKVTLSAAASGDLTPQWEFALPPTGLVQSRNTVTFAAVAGQTYTVGLSTGTALGHYTLDLRLDPARAASPVTQVGPEVRVSGSAGDDNFAFSVAAGVYRLTVNGVNYQFDRQSVNSFVFDGSSGRDTIVLQAGPGCTAALRPGAVDLRGSGYKIHTANVEHATVRAGSGPSRAMFYDSPGDDTFAATPAFAELSGPGFVNRAEGFSTVCATASRGVDVAWLYDSPGNDTLSTTPTDTTLSGRGFSNRARSFDEIHASGDAGGYDVAVLYNSIGAMRLRAAGKKAEVSFGGLAADATSSASIAANGTPVPTTTAALSGFEYARVLSYRGKVSRLGLAAIDFVLEIS